MLLFSKIWKSQEQEKDKIVFLHGMGGVGQLWRSIAVGLEKNLSILAPDQPGHGGSREQDVREFGPTAFAHDLAETMDANSFDRAWIAGHSMGTRTAAAFADLYQSRVKGLILIDLGFSGPAGGGMGQKLEHFMQVLPESFVNRTDARDFMMDACPDASMVQYLLAVSYIDPVDSRLKFPFDPQAMLKILHSAKNNDITDVLHRLGQANVPVLVLRGADSRVFLKEEFDTQKGVYSCYPSFQFVEIQGAGHGLPFEKRIEFLQVLKEFIGIKV